MQRIPVVAEYQFNSIFLWILEMKFLLLRSFSFQFFSLFFLFPRRFLIMHLVRFRLISFTECDRVIDLTRVIFIPFLEFFFIIFECFNTFNFHCNCVRSLWESETGGVFLARWRDRLSETVYELENESGDTKKCFSFDFI